MKLSASLTSPARTAARWSRRLGVVAVVGVAGVTVTPAQSFAPAASFAVPQQQDREADPPQDPADAVVQASSSPALAVPSVVDDVPAPALRAYRFAAAVLARTDADCGLDWSLLAAIGDVESDHGRYARSVLHADGTSTPSILGPQLDGVGDVAAVPDSDDGRLDADTRWDHAVGPMQFIPSTWAVVGSDADGDGTRDPHDLDDAALSAAAYLCAGPDDLSTVEGQRAAVYRYNPSHSYVRLVLQLAAAYADQRVATSLPVPAPRGGSVEVPTVTGTIDRSVHPATPPREDASATAPALLPSGRSASGHGSARHLSDRQPAGSAQTSSTSTRSTGGAGGSNSTGSGGGTTRGGTTSGGTTGGSTPPTGSGTPTQDPVPSGGSGGGGSSDAGTPPDSTAGGGGTADGGSTGGSPQPPPSVSGALQRADDGTWSVGGNVVDFGDDVYLNSAALNDFDGADGVESNLGELETLLGSDVTVVLNEGSQVVVRLNDLAYR